MGRQGGLVSTDIEKLSKIIKEQEVKITQLEKLKEKHLRLLRKKTKLIKQLLKET